MSTDALPPVTIPRGLVNRLLTSISESGPWGPVLAELTYFALVVLAASIAWWFFGGPAIRALAKRVGAPVDTLRPLRTGVRVIVAAIALGALLGHFAEVDLFTIVAGAFALIATGFVALWSSLSNILCTFLILVTRPFRIGDEISFPPDPIEGEVIDLSFFFTTLRTTDGRFVNVPNTMFFQRIVVRRETSTSGRELGEQLAHSRPTEVPANSTGPT